MSRIESLKRTMEYRAMVDVLMSEDRYADLVLVGGTIVNTLTRETYVGDVAVKGRYILMVGDCSQLVGPETVSVNVEGRYLSPGFIDSHMHFESSMLTITEFSRLSIPSGTTTLVADPHEIGNALGPAGMKAMADEAGTVPNHVYLVVPCLVPDCPALETSGVDVSSKDVEALLDYPKIIGIGEMQGFSNAKHVYRNTPEIITDLMASSSYAMDRNGTVDGNAPELFGAELAAHILVTGGRTSCHETTTKAECVEKLRQGVFVFMREGSTQKNMAECIRAVTEEGLDSRRCILATDDMVADDLRNLGHMNEIVRRTIRQGVDPIEAIQMVTINPASYFRFEDRGALAPGKLADVVVLDDLFEMTVEAVFIEGKLTAHKGKLLVDLPPYVYPDNVKNSVRRAPLSRSDLEIRSDAAQATGNCIVAIPDQNLTDTLKVSLPVSGGLVSCDPKNDVLYIACIERYGRNGNIGKAFVRGFGMKQGAIAESVAHDTHNIIVAGGSLEDMVTAVNRVIEMGGGIALANRGRILDSLRLPVGGLISDEQSGAEMAESIRRLSETARTQLNCALHEPFMHLSFLALSTSPKWKITDKGLVDVENFRILPPID
ncbi:adenine deaminase [Fretibacterium sp. OH1220_COT-178]|uniref:adenine deaminase n=1 Tax=Fretibacterium sp. OH1220_COT-178 TaxID=2491047 RepID=UPI000F5F9EC1|nr:adenine deaminase C-terminal domain-containing protein [Fretibacterium sp. OH1220_COT-178]RRD65988.1 adenine deaminase [Fretibacterium sp. OH1220_COT-178]